MRTEELRVYTRNQVLDAMPHVLSKAEQEIVSARWGLDSGKSLTLAEVWSKFGVTNEQIL